MRDKDLYAKLLGVDPPWHVRDVDAQLKEGRVEVFIEFKCERRGMSRRVLIMRRSKQWFRRPSIPELRQFARRDGRHRTTGKRVQIEVTGRCTDPDPACVTFCLAGGQIVGAEEWLPSAAFHFGWRLRLVHLEEHARS